MSDPESSEKPAAIPYATPRPRRRFRIALVVALVGISLTVLALVAIGLGPDFTATGIVTVNLGPPPPPATIPMLPALPPPPPVPPALNLPAEPPRLTIKQRSGEPIPGSDYTLYIHIGDITGGHVRLEVGASDRRTLAVKTVRPGDTVDFALDGNRYVIVVARFDNRLAGTDRAEFVVRRAEDPPAGEERIGRLLEAAAKSGAVMVPRAAADASTGDAPAAELEEPKPLDDYLRGVWTVRKPASMTPEALAAEAVRATDSTTVPPRVRLRDGSEMPLEAWLAAELPKLK